MSFDPYLMFLSVLFGLIGWAALIFGKKKRSFRHILIALALMIFPYFVAHLTYSLAIGGGLTLLLFWP